MYALYENGPHVVGLQDNPRMLGFMLAAHISSILNCPCFKYIMHSIFSHINYSQFYTVLVSYISSILYFYIYRLFYTVLVSHISSILYCVCFTYIVYSILCLFYIQSNVLSSQPVLSSHTECSQTFLKQTLIFNWFLSPLSSNLP